MDSSSGIAFLSPITLMGNQALTHTSENDSHQPRLPILQSGRPLFADLANILDNDLQLLTSLALTALCNRGLPSPVLAAPAPLPKLDIYVNARFE